MTTTMTEQQVLVDALKACGFKPTVQDAASVRGHGSEMSRQKCDVVLRKEDHKRKADIGFAKTKDGTYQIVTDTYVNSDLSKLDDFLAPIRVEYTKLQVKKDAKRAGGTFVGMKTLSNGKIRMRFAVAGR